ncbi:MAG: hypothetical protein F4X83_12275 [Chloroflexi bacterium]|nr:hypothetical protein [Chloroflexota bacterium]
MKLTIYTLATDCDNGTNAQVFVSEDTRDDALLEWVGSSREDWQASDLADDLHAFVQTKTGYLDTFSTDEQQIEVDPAQLITVNQAWFRCKDAPGSFGNLYDPDEVMEIMSNWSEAGDEGPDSHWFDPKDSEDHAAILAWCDQVGPDFEEQISRLVCENLPTRKTAFEALEAKHKLERQQDAA